MFFVPTASVGPGRQIYWILLTSVIGLEKCFYKWTPSNISMCLWLQTSHCDSVLRHSASFSSAAHLQAGPAGCRRLQPAEISTGAAAGVPGTRPHAHTPIQKQRSDSVTLCKWNKAKQSLNSQLWCRSLCVTLRRLVHWKIDFNLSETVWRWREFNWFNWKEKKKWKVDLFLYLLVLFFCGCIIVVCYSDTRKKKKKKTDIRNKSCIYLFNLKQLRLCVLFNQAAWYPFSLEWTHFLLRRWSKFVFFPFLV